MYEYVSPEFTPMKCTMCLEGEPIEPASST